MRLVLLLSAVGITIAALRIFFALKTAHADDPQRQKTSREEKTVPANTGAPLPGADARGGTGIEVAAPPAVSTGTKRDRKSTRLNSSHLVISYAVFCLKKKKKIYNDPIPIFHPQNHR